MTNCLDLAAKLDGERPPEIAEDVSRDVIVIQLIVRDENTSTTADIKIPCGHQRACLQL